MAVDTQKVIDRMELYAPEHVLKSQNIKESAVDAAISSRINVDKWAEAGALLDGAAYLTAHILSMRDKSQSLPSSKTGAGPIEEITEGELRISWDTSANQQTHRTIDADLAQTEYGIAFENIAETIPASPFMSE